MSQLGQIASQEGTPPAIVLLNLLSGMILARALHVAAQLGVADLLHDGPKDIAELAVMTNTHPPSLHRLLRTLAAVDVFTEVEPNRFAQSMISNYLRSDVIGSMHDLALMWGSDWELSAWSQLAYSVRTGNPAFEYVFGMDLWSYFEHKNPAAGELFNRALTNFSEQLNLPITRSYDFTSFSTLVDVGGGHGSFLITVMQAHPNLKAVLFDRAPIIEETRARIRDAGLDSRCTLVAGDFFKDVPPGADAYLLKQVLHDWDDQQCGHILRNCRRAMQRGAKLLLIEQVILPHKDASFARFLDLEMLIAQRGRERTEAEFNKLCAAAGFEVKRLVPTPTPHTIIEAVAI